MFISVTQASTLSSSQVQAIISLLKSFGADQATLYKVQQALSLNVTTSHAIATNTNLNCPNIKHTLYLGTSDASTNGDVSRLQSFLKQTGDFTYPQITGFLVDSQKKPLSVFNVEK